MLSPQRHGEHREGMSEEIDVMHPPVQAESGERKAIFLNADS
jgi:hypothetical protein